MNNKFNNLVPIIIWITYWFNRFPYVIFCFFSSVIDPVLWKPDCSTWRQEDCIQVSWDGSYCSLYDPGIILYKPACITFFHLWSFFLKENSHSWEWLLSSSFTSFQRCKEIYLYKYYYNTIISCGQCKFTARYDRLWYACAFIFGLFGELNYISRDFIT